MSDASRHEANRASRLARAAMVRGSGGKICPAESATLLLEAIIEPGDRVAIEGDNQKQADFLASALALANPARLHDLHIVQSVLALPEHLAVFERGIANRLDFADAGPQSRKLADPLRRRCSGSARFIYSVSNCQDGLRGVSFGNFLINQVVEKRQSEFPRLTRFSTLSPVPGFRRWLAQQGADRNNSDITAPPMIASNGGWRDQAQNETVRCALMQLCATYLTRRPSPGIRIDPVARFRLGNGARLERINWLGNTAPRAIEESFGIMVNYLYDHDTIEDNHEAFVRDGAIVRSRDIDILLETDPTTGARATTPTGGDRRHDIRTFRVRMRTAPPTPRNRTLLFTPATTENDPC